MLCIFAATVFWFFNALNKNYSTNINFPVTFDYDQDHYIAVRDLPASVRMNVTGSGWDLFRRSLGFKVPPLVVPLEQPSETRKIVGTTLPAIFAGQLERLKINFVITDTVRVHLEEKLTKKLNIRLDSAHQFIDTGFGLTAAPVVTPDTVWVEGPKELITRLSTDYQLMLPQKNIRKDLNEEIELKFRQGNLLVATPAKVNVSLMVEKFEEVSRRVRLDIVNIPFRLKRGTMVKEVSCAYRLPVSVARTFSGDSLRAVIDLNQVSKGEHRLVPEIVGLPAVAHVVKADTVVINL